MLAEFLADRGGWTQVMPGARACLFSLRERPVPLPLRLEPFHFEALFCLAGSITLTRRDGSTLTAGTRQVLLLTNLSDLAGASVDAPLEGVLIAVDARGARESLQTICDLLGGLTLDTGQVRRWMASRGGCAVEGPTDWSRAAFANLDCLPQSRVSGRAGVCGSRWSFSICSAIRKDRRTRPQRWNVRRCEGWLRSAGIWRNTWTSP